MKKIALFIVLLLVNGAFLSFAEEAKKVEGGTVRLSLGYQSEGACESSKNSNNSNYGDFVRSSCLKSGSLYYYYICEKINNFCANVGGTLNLEAQNTGSSVLGISANGNKYLSSIPTKILPKLNKIVIKLKGLSLPRLRSIDLKLRKAAIKYKDQPGLLNVIHFLQFETSSFITAKLSTDGIDGLLCEVGGCDNEVTQTGAAIGGLSLAQQDVKSNGYGLGSMRTLTGKYKGNTVHIIDKGVGMHTVIPNGNGLPFDYLGNKAPKKFWDKYVKSLTNNDIYSIRVESPEKGKAQIIDINHQYFQRILKARIPVNSRHTLVLSQIPGNITQSEFTGKCEVTDPNRKDVAHTKITVYPLEKRKFYIDKYGEGIADHLYCYIPTGTKYYINVKADKNVVKNCNQPENSKYKCLLNVGMSRFKNYNTPEAKKRQDFYSRNISDNSPMENLPEESIIGNKVEPVQVGTNSLAQQDTKANGYGFGSNKTLKGVYKGREVFIVDQGQKSLATTVLPGMMNGEGGLRDSQKQWSGAKNGTIYAVRIEPEKNFSSGWIMVGTMPFGGNKTVPVLSRMSISETPGEMIPFTKEGKCSLGIKSSANEKISFMTEENLLKVPENPITSGGISRDLIRKGNCIINPNKKYYLNVEVIAPENSSKCESANKNKCNVYLEFEGFTGGYEKIGTNPIVKKLNKLDPNAFCKYHYDYTFATKNYKKSDLDSKILKNGKKLYIVNPSSNSIYESLVPACINGGLLADYNESSKYPKRVQCDRKIGIKEGEVYASRIKAKKGFKLIKIGTRGADYWGGGKGVSALVKVNISDIPGEMDSSPFEGNCTTDKRKDIYLVSSKKSKFYTTNTSVQSCVIPDDKVVYINIELIPGKNSHCKYKTCTQSISTFGDREIPKGISEGTPEQYSHLSKKGDIDKICSQVSPSSTAKNLFKVAFNGNRSVLAPITPPIIGEKSSCRLKDGVITDYKGPFYDKTNNCKQDIEIRGCNRGTLWNGGFSPAYSRNDVYNFYKNKDKCLGKVSLSASEVLNLSSKMGANSYQYKIDYTNLSNLKISIDRQTVILSPNNVSKTFTVNFNSLGKGKCGDYIKWGEGTIIRTNKKFQTYFKFCKESDGRLGIYHRVKTRNTSNRFIFGNIMLRHGKVKLTQGADFINKGEKISASSVSIQQPVIQNYSNSFSCKLRDGVITTYKAILGFRRGM